MFAVKVTLTLVDMPVGHNRTQDTPLLSCLFLIVGRGHIGRWIEDSDTQVPSFCCFNIIEYGDRVFGFIKSGQYFGAL